ncbi:cell surface glycoprotein 1-like isoform X2 [Callorhinchus milii]|uniref:cell surface glycoprotein 1-like isoform X2 n=1 Tax=Callorhinchus milii TaxID=7868 RepID=UPI001C3F639E|nr:cell surface glycoprotein 1-like isoform X2 [Callorhinchus milii]
MRELRSSPQARGDNKDHPSIKELTRVFELGDSSRSIGKNVKQEMATETEGDLKGSKEKPSVSSQLKTDELAQSLKELSEIFESNASGEVSGKEANCEDPVKNEDKLHLVSGPEVRAEQQDLSERRQSFELSDEDRPNEGTVVVATKPGESPEGLRDKSIEESLDDGTSCEDRGSLEESLLTTPALSPSTLPSSDSQATSVLSSPHSSEGKDESMSNCDTNSPSEQTDTSASSASLAVQDPMENGQECIKSTTKGMGEFGETSIEIGQEDEDRLTASQDTSDVAEEALVRDIGVAMSASSSEDYNSCLDSDISEEMSTVLEDSDEADRDQLQSLDVSHREDEKGIAAETLQIERKETETDENSEVSRANQDGVIADEPAENKEDIKTENPSLNIGEQDTKEQVALDPEVDKTFNSEVDKMMDMTLNPKMAIKNSSNKTTLAKETAKAKGPSKSPLAKLFGFSDSGNAKKTTAEQLKPHKPNSQSASNLEKTQEQKVSHPEKSQEKIIFDLEKAQEQKVSDPEKSQEKITSDLEKSQEKITFNLEKAQEQKVSDPEKSQEQITSDLEKSQEKITFDLEEAQEQKVSDLEKSQEKITSDLEKSQEEITFDLEKAQEQKVSDPEKSQEKITSDLEKSQEKITFDLEKAQEKKVSDPEKSQEQITSDLEKSQEKIISKVEKFQKQGASDSKKTSKEPEVKEDGSEDLLVLSGSQTSSEHSTEASLNTSLTELPIEPTKTTTEQTQPNSVMGKMAGTNAVESRPTGGNVASDVTDLFDPLSQDPNPGTEPSQQPNSSPNSADLLDFEDRG